MSVADSATYGITQSEEDLGDLLLEALPPDGSTMGNLSAREALSRAAGQNGPHIKDWNDQARKDTH